MPLTAANLTSPVGELGLSLFPSLDPGTFTSWLTAWLNDGYAQATAAGKSGSTADNAARQWAYYRAYREVWIRKSNEASTLSIQSEGSRQTLITQIQNFKDLADQALASATELLASEDDVTTAPGTVVNVLPGSRSTRVAVEWG